MYNNHREGKEKVLVISDMQIPAEHRDALAFLKACKDAIQPTKVVCIGDITDQNALSFHIRNADLPSAEDEFKQSQRTLNKIYELFPETVLLSSNHDIRVLRVAESAGIPTRCLKPFLDLINAPAGWSMVDEIVIDDVLYMHGDAGRGGLNASLKKAQDSFMSVVCGHYHASFEIAYYGNSSKLIFGMTVGSLLNQKHLAFKYARKIHRKSIIGLGVCLYGLPILIPMHLTKSGRWTGKLPKAVASLSL